MSEVNAEALKIVEKQIDDKLIVFEGKIKGNFDTTEIKKELSDLTVKFAEITMQKDAVEKLSSQLDEIQSTQKVQENSKSKFEPLSESIFKAFTEPKIAEQLKSIGSGGKQTEPIRVEVTKAAVDLTTLNTIGAGSTQVSLTENTGKITGIRQRAAKYLAEVSTGSIGNSRALWIEETDEQGTPIFIAEGDAKTPLSVKYLEKTQEVQKIAVYGKVTTELMADLPQLMSYIQNNLVKRVVVAIETGLMTGDGAGENLKGFKTYATTFAAGALALAIDNANEFDVLEAMALQVEIANGVPNVVFVHPSTLSKMIPISSH